jgi:class 3 adenylate cyclase
VISLSQTTKRRRTGRSAIRPYARGTYVTDAATTPTVPVTPSGERRHVTVLFADMVGFTAISERLGEEGTFALIEPIYELMASAVREQGGSVKDFAGDGIMALFGVPDALEDGPLRACRAGLAIHERLAAALPAIEANHCVRPQVRIGLNSGIAVVAEIRGEGGAATALGDTVNLASRLQTLAEPGTVYLSEATQRLVKGQVETTFAGERVIKGKAEPQKVYRLETIRLGSTRFDAAVVRGLSLYVGREREQDVLRRALDEARQELRVIDIVGEAGMGKSRLLHEFRRRAGESRIAILSGTCSPDGQQTPFLPFIEVVRGSFQVRVGEAEAEIARKLDTGLSVLGLQSSENLALLLNLLGLRPPEGALAGLDGVLIGLRTRELLQQLLDGRCRLSPVLLLIEDLHWIDSVSEEVLGKIVCGETKRPLLVLHTRRPDYKPGWLDLPTIMALRLEPLPAGDVKRIIQARLGVDALPDTLAHLVMEKAEGNALFTEEIVNFLVERGALRAVGGTVEFDAGKIGATLPASLQSLLTARVDRLAPQERALLQAAAVIGRRFDPQLLAVLSDDRVGVEGRLIAMQAIDLVYPVAKTGEYAFRHALVRDALYQSLLTEPRTALHLKISEEVKRRSGNRLTEVVEILAHHYSQTKRTDKALTYLAMAGEKSLGVYSIDEASTYFAAALALLDKTPDCASDEQVIEFLSSYVLLLNLSGQINLTIGLLGRYLTRVDHQGDDPRVVIIRYHYAHALFLNARYREAEEMQREASSLAARLGDGRSKAYAFAGDTFLGPFMGSKPRPNFERLREEAVRAAVDTQDVYLQNQVRYAMGQEEMFRGGMNNARDWALELLNVGRKLNDPRSTGFGLNLLAFIALVSDSPAEALEYSEQSLAVVVTPVDRLTALGAKAFSLTLLRRIDEAAAALETYRSHCVAHGYLFGSATSEAFFGFCQIFQGEITDGVHLIEKAVVKRDSEGLLNLADLFRLNLAEVYLGIIAGEEKSSILVLLKNLPVLLLVKVTAYSRVQSLITRVLQNPNFDPAGYQVGRAQMVLGLLYKAKKKRALAARHLAEAKRIATQFGATPMLAKINAALAELH